MRRLVEIPTELVGSPIPGTANIDIKAAVGMVMLKWQTAGVCWEKGEFLEENE